MAESFSRSSRPNTTRPGRFRTSTPNACSRLEGRALQGRAGRADEGLLVARLADDAAQGRGVRAQARVADVRPALDADAVASFLEARLRRLDAAQLIQLARDFRAVEIANQVRHRFVARIGRRAGELARRRAA